MYRLTPRMRQEFRRLLGEYHKIFDGGRCEGWELEELIYKSILSDNRAQHLARWNERGHDPEADITVEANGGTYKLQIKSGKMTADHLILSGSRHTTYNGDLSLISEALRKKRADFITVPYRTRDDENGKSHIYRLGYIDAKILSEVSASDWTRLVGPKGGIKWVQQNRRGVKFSLAPNMSWQVWWKVPIGLVDYEGDEFEVVR